MFRLRRLQLAYIIAFLLAGYASAQSGDPANYNISHQGVIIDGFDVVSYFIGAPQKGKAELSVNYAGVEYWFASEDNRKIFEKNPEKFVPAYGGWCAFAMGESGKKVKIEPRTYKVVEGRLYLFYNFYFNNTLIDWNKDEVSLKKKADDNWQKLN